jgi:hypothetical protein
MPDPPPVWYLQAGISDAAGNFSPRTQASAVLVMAAPLRADGSPGHPEQLLLTVQHAIRSQSDPKGGKYEGPFWTAYRAWPAGSHYLNKYSHPLELHPVLVPDANAVFTHATDLVFLKFTRGQNGHHAASLLKDEEIEEGMKKLTVLGYDSGEDLHQANEDEVIPAPHSGWTYHNYLINKDSGVLADGGSNPQPGASGGAVMSEDRVAGLYRGAFPGLGQHVFMPLPVIRKWCELRGYLLLNHPGRKKRIKLPFLPFVGLALLPLVIWAAFAFWPATYHFKGRVMTLPPGAAFRDAVPVAGARVTPVYERAEQPHLAVYTNERGEFDIRTREEKYSAGYTYLTVRKDGFVEPPAPRQEDTWHAVEDPGEGRKFFIKPAPPQP